MKKLDLIRLTLSLLKIKCHSLISFHHIHLLRFLLILFSLLLLLLLFLLILILLLLISTLCTLGVNFLYLEMSNQINNRKYVLLAEGFFIKQF